MSCKYLFERLWHASRTTLYMGLFFIVSQSLFAAPVAQQLHVDSAPDYQQLNHALYYYLDPSTELALENIEDNSHSIPFKLYKGNVPDFGHTNDAVWYRLAMANRSKQSRVRILQIGVGWLDDITVFAIRADGSITESRHGDFLPFGDRLFKHNLPLFELDLEPGLTTVYIRILSRDLMFTPLSLWDPARFDLADRWYQRYFAMIYGAFAVMILYNGLLFLILRNPAYLYYVCYLSAFTLANLSYNGFLYELVWPYQPDWLDWLRLFLLGMAQVTGILFVMSLLSTKQSSPAVHRFLVCFLAAFVIAYTVSALSGEFYLNDLVVIGFIILYSLVLITVGLILWHRGNPVAKIFVFACFSGLIGTSITAMTVFGWIPFTLFNYHAAELGILVDMTLLAMALAYRFNVLRNEKELVEQRYLENLTQAKLDLEKEVFRQTSELRIAKDNAEKAARTDVLTDLNNRRAFYDIAENSCLLAQRYDYPLSVIILDVDHFKKINDSYGHATGDRVLKLIADALRHHLRKTDIAGRLGGEEFALLLPQTTLAKAAYLAEKIRKIISEIKLKQEGRKVTFTASFGVCELEDENESIHGLVAKADQAMYEAKAAGRNKVVEYSLKNGTNG